MSLIGMGSYGHLPRIPETSLVIYCMLVSNCILVSYCILVERLRSESYFRLVLKEVEFFYRILLKFGCPVNMAEDERGYTPLFNAVKFGSLPVVIELIENGANVNFLSKEQKTPLFQARSYDIVKYLMQKGAKPIFQFKNYQTQDKEGKSPQIIKINAIKHLMKYNPEAAIAVFDHCLDIDNKNNLIMDLQLFDSEGDKESQEEMKVLKTAMDQSILLSIEDNNLKKLIILHPLLQIFLNWKFRSIRPHFWFLLAFQFVMVVTLTLLGVIFVQFTACKSKNITLDSTIAPFENRYISTDHITKLKMDLDESWNSLKCEKNIVQFKNESTNGCVLEELCKIYYDDNTKTIGSCWTFHWFTITTWLVLGLHILKECFELFSKESVFYYFLNLENLLELFILVCAVFFLVISNFDVEMAYHASAWMIFFAWINLIFYVGRMSLLGKYIFMSIHVMRVLFLCLFAYLPIFFGFTFGYYILLQANENFNGYIRGFISVLAMMIDDIGYQQFDYNSIEEEGGINGSTQLLTVFFMVFVSLILVNLLIAVTVSNTEILKDQSRIHISNRRISQLDEVMKFREWCLFKILAKILPILRKIGRPVLEGEMNFKMVSCQYLFLSSIISSPGNVINHYFRLLKSIPKNKVLF